MSDIKNWSNSAGGNTSASPNGFPEGMLPSGVNDSMRETMASVKRWYEDAEWINFNHTPTFVDTGTFLVSAGQSATATYHPGRRIKVLDGSSTIFGTIHSSTWTASAVYIYSTNDAGANFTASISGVSVGIISVVNPSLSYVASANSASACTRAQYADSAGYANAGWDGTAARNFGSTASANTIPVANASGKLDANFIPAGATNEFTITSVAVGSIALSSTVLTTLTTIITTSGGKYEVGYTHAFQSTTTASSMNTAITLSSGAGNVISTINTGTSGILDVAGQAIGYLEINRNKVVSCSTTMTWILKVAYTGPGPGSLRSLSNVYRELRVRN